MKFAPNRFAFALALFAGAAALIAPAARALPVSVDLTSLRAIQTYALNKTDDQAYLLVSGVANGKEFSDQLPKASTWKISPKAPVGTVKAPVTLWSGNLEDGEFALITVTLMQGTGMDAAKIQEYLDKKSAAEKTATERSKPKLAATDSDNLAAGTVKAQQGVIKDIKKTLSRDLKTDHFGGLFNVLVVNLGGKIVKRIDPVGLTFGEHYGTDAKTYSKIKNTRANVLIKDEATGEWSEQQVTPLNDDLDALRIKMLDTEIVKSADGKPAKNITDYVAEIQVKAEGKALKWELGDDHPGPTDLHVYWDFAK